MSLSDRQLIKEIKNNKNVEQNLGIFSGKMADLYYKKAVIDLSFNYYTLYEMYYDKENSELETLRDTFEELNNILYNTLLSDFDAEIMEDSIKRIYGLRNDVIENMNVITYYTDALTIYEYVLNRIDGRFNEDLLDLEDKIIVNKIVNYIFDTKDNIIINDKIKEIIGELPVRMTKRKYFDLIKGSISTYRGSEKSSVDDYMYMLKSSSMLYIPERLEELYLPLKEFLEKLKETDYSSIDKSSHLELVKKLNEKADFLKERVDAYVILVHIINTMCAALLTRPYAETDKYDDEKTGKSILNVVYEHFKMGIKEDITVKCEEMLIKLEGRPEFLTEKIELFEGALYEIKIQYKTLIESLMLNKVYSCIGICEKLLSNSMFAEIEEKESCRAEADEDYINKISEEFIAELAVSFEKNHKAVNRAVMANTISKIPVFFLNSQEVAEYVLNAFNNCSDEGEKRASKYIINELIEEYNNYFGK